MDITGKLAMRPPLLPVTSSSKERGFSLIEILVSIVVLSFGVLGMVGLQAAALKNNRDARLQSEALGLARELAEMMRANPSVATKSTGNPYLGNFGGRRLTPDNPSNCLNLGAKCDTPTDTANAQMTEWLARANDKLPGIRVTVCMDIAPYEAASGLPQWACTPPTSAEQNISFIKLGWTREDTEKQIKLATDNGVRPYVILPVTPGGQL